jgi:hypothetical protein
VAERLLETANVAMARRSLMRAPTGERIGSVDVS